MATRPITDENDENLLDETNEIIRDEQEVGGASFFRNSGMTYTPKRNRAFKVQ